MTITEFSEGLALAETEALARAQYSGVPYVVIRSEENEWNAIPQSELSDTDTVVFSTEIC
jgi:hypothetical protein